MDEDTFEEFVGLARIFLERSPPLKDTPGAAHAVALAAEHPEDIERLQSVLILFSKDEQRAWDAVAAMAAASLRNPWETISDELAQWAADFIAGKLPRPKKGKKKFARRDLVIAEAIYLLTVVRRIKPTRRWEKNRRRITECCSEGGSACDAVGVVVGMNYKTVERIWGEWGPHATKRLKSTGRESTVEKWVSAATSPKFGINSDLPYWNLRQLPGNNRENRNDRHRSPAAPR